MARRPGYRALIQAVPPLADPLLLVTVVVVVALGVAAAVPATQGRRRAGARLAAAAAGLVAAYGLALVGAGFLSRPVDLAQGEAKCFDDWCVVLVATHGDSASNSLTANLQIENRGRGRAMRSDLARAYLDVGNRQIAPRDSAPLHALVDPGAAVPAELTFSLPLGRRARLVVVEDGGTAIGPGTFEIGGESSPFHARMGWPV